MIDDDTVGDPTPPTPARNPRPPREDWRQWLPAGVPEPSTITRAELLTEVRRHGIAVSERELRYWESLHALPRPVRKFRNGAMQATYPWWHDEVVAELLQLRGRSRSWDEIGARLRQSFKAFATRTTPAPWKPNVPAIITPDAYVAIQRLIADMNRGRDEKILFADLRLYTGPDQYIPVDILPPQEDEDE